MNYPPLNQWLPITDARWATMRMKIKVRNDFQEEEFICSSCSRHRILAMRAKEWMALEILKR